MTPRIAIVLSSLVLASCNGSSSPDGTGAPDPGATPGSSGASAPAPGGTTPLGGSSGNPASDGGAIEPASNGFPAAWIDGTQCATEAKVQSWKYAEGTYILRQSLCTNFEGPFTYLLVGGKKALFVDTGTGAVDLQAEVAKLLAGKDVELVVAHSHSHGDHLGGDKSFNGKPQTTVVGTSVNAVRQFFGLNGNDPSAFDLGGGRIVDVLALPGHQAAHIAVYDRTTKLLLTGDTLYPGRLYIDDWSSYRESVPRLVAFVDAGHPVSWVLGGHIEMPKTGSDYAFGSQVHPNEHALQLTDKTLRELATAVVAMGATPKREVHADFIVSP